jgi:hypothetical protein
MASKTWFVTLNAVNETAPRGFAGLTVGECVAPLTVGPAHDTHNEACGCLPMPEPVILPWSSWMTGRSMFGEE